MKVLNLIWGFGIGGICKCYQTYARFGEVDPHGAAACFEEIFSDYPRALRIGKEGRMVAETVFNGSVQARKLHDLAVELVGGRE